MSGPLVSINLAVFNGEKYLRHCLEAVKNQTYPNLEINILDNASTDRTNKIIKSFISKNINCKLWTLNSNLGMWPGQEKLLENSRGKYILALSVDVLLHPEFIAQAVEIMEKNETIGALQSKTLQYNLSSPQYTIYNIQYTNLIDTVGFKIQRNRRIINIGHGEEDKEQYNRPMEIFGVEGAVPFFRRTALEDCRIDGKIIDEDMFWYGDDLDLAWRLHLFGWKQIYHPKVIAYHDRSTTKGMSKSWKDYLKRIAVRKKIPLFKRGLDWRNKRLTRLKNDYARNIWHDLPFILRRELTELGYIILFEPKILPEILKFIKLIPKTLRKRQAVLARAKINASAMQKWFQ